MFFSEENPLTDSAVLNKSTTSLLWWPLSTEEQYLVMSKQTIKELKTSKNKLSTSFKTSVVFDVYATYVFPSSSSGVNPTISFYIHPDSLGVSYITESDPVSITLLGSISGAFNLVALVFSIVFGFSVREKWYKVDNLRVRAQARSDEEVRPPYVDDDVEQHHRGHLLEVSAR
jgi:hypothetical protein